MSSSLFLLDSWALFKYSENHPIIYDMKGKYFFPVCHFTLTLVFLTAQVFHFNVGSYQPFLL